MNADFEIRDSKKAGPARQTARPAPSLRIPVTAANRALLRRLRAAESSAWEAGQGCLRRASSHFAPFDNSLQIH